MCCRYRLSTGLLASLLVNLETPPLLLEDLGVMGSGRRAVGVQWVFSTASDPHFPFPDAWMSACVTPLSRLGAGVKAGRDLGGGVLCFLAVSVVRILCSCSWAEGRAGEAPRSAGKATAAVLLDEGVFLKEAREEGGLFPSTLSDTCLTLFDDTMRLLAAERVSLGLRGEGVAGVTCLGVLFFIMDGGVLMADTLTFCKTIDGVFVRIFLVADALIVFI